MPPQPGGPASPAGAPPLRLRRRRALVPALVACGLIVAVAAGAVAVRSRSGGGTSPAPAGASTGAAATSGVTPSSTPAGALRASPATGNAELDAFIPHAEAFIEQQHNLTFKAAVPITLLSNADFEQRLKDDGMVGGTGGGSGASATPTIDQVGREYVALHLIPPGTNLGDSVNTALTSGVEGFYDPKTKALTVRGTQLTPYVRGVLVHELTHALQDQVFGLTRPDLRAADDERQESWTALVEGDAVRVQNAFKASLSSADQQSWDAAEQATAGSSSIASVPQSIIEIIVYPYVAGPVFVQTLIDRGGLDGLHRSFSSPPTTSSQVLHPERYLAGLGAAAVTEPTSSGSQFDKGVIGEYGLRVMLEQLVQRGAISIPILLRDTPAWGGDRYVAYTEGTQACVRAAFVAKSASDRPLLLDALQRYATAYGSELTDPGSGPLTLTTCA